MKKLLLIGLLAILASCSYETRFNRLIERHPDLIRTDTIIRYDTVKVIVPEVKTDTAFVDSLLYDTVYIEKDRLKIKMWKVVDTVHVEGKCESDTVTVVREVIVPVKYYKDGNKWWHDIPWWVYLIAILALVLWILSYVRKKTGFI